MRQLSFKKYLKQYLIDISGQSSLSIHRLSNLSISNIRILDALILYCLFNDKLNVLYRYKNINQSLKLLNKDNYLSDTYKDYSFQKIHQSYQRKVNTPYTNNQIKSMIRANIILMMKEKKISKYRIYTDLKLNPGNINDYLANDNSKKVSLETVKRIYQYCLDFK